MRRHTFTPLAFAAFAFTCIGCKPDFGERESRVTEPRILAVQAEPAESKPGTSVKYTILVGAPDGTVANPSASWAFCATPKLPTENNIVSEECLRDGVRAIGDPSPTVEAPTPNDACALFGPETPPGDYRPRDPDSTGGYFQPIRAVVGSVLGFGLTRIVCNLANAPADATLEFKKRYVPNRNPTPGVLSATIGGTASSLGQIPSGSSVRFRLVWAEGDAEAYVAFDASRQAVVDRRESMRVSWFATGGTFESDRTGRLETETEPFTDNTWIAPLGAGPVHMWTVLRDARGGVAFAAYELTITP